MPAFGRLPLAYEYVRQGKHTTIIRNFKFQRQIFKPIEFDVFKIKQDYHFANVRKIITREDLFPK